MLRAFATYVKARYLVLSSIPAEDYPPANIASMIKQCLVLGRDDLADQIRMQWAKVLNKYPATRLNWGAAVKIGGASLKKNIFGGNEFAVWLGEQRELTPAQIKTAQAVVSIMPPAKGTPALAVPADGETVEDWKEAAAGTKEALIAAKKGFTDVRKYISFLEQEAQTLTQKIASYSKGGDKATTKGGKPHKLTERVPKWSVILSSIVEQLDDTKAKFQEAETGFKEAASNYNEAPLTTVAYEKKAQDNLSAVLELILDMKDLDKQKELLIKLNESLAKQKATASVSEIVAGDLIGSLFERLKASFKTIKNWLSGLTKSVNSFNKLASIRY